jgi:uncharacterized peroxidase-related enzyme
VAAVYRGPYSKNGYFRIEREQDHAAEREAGVRPGAGGLDEVRDADGRGCPEQAGAEAGPEDGRRAGHRVRVGAHGRRRHADRIIGSCPALAVRGSRAVESAPWRTSPLLPACPGSAVCSRSGPRRRAPLGALADVLLHAPNTLSAGERELIAAYVSSLNDCAFCHASHAAIAACHLDDDEALVAAVVHGPEHAPVSPKLKALLAVARRVQQGGRTVREDDIARARREGATDTEIHDTVLIAAAFCMFNRYVDGLATWTPTDAAGYRESARRVARHGYSASLPGR